MIAPATNVIGLRTRQVNHDFDYGDGPENQIAHMDGLGMFDAPLPPQAEWARLADPSADGPVEPRARAYLEANCAHCHQPGGLAGSTGLDLRYRSDLAGMGICKIPVAAGPGSGGRSYVIVPGAPDESILIYRVKSENPEEKMPELPTVTADRRGAQLLSEWIAAMDPDTCMAP